MTSTFQTEFAADAAPELIAEFGRAVEYHSPTGTIATITAQVRHLPTTTQARSNHRVRVESAELLAFDTAGGLESVADGTAVDLDGDPTTPLYAYRDTVHRSGGLITVLFERVTILDTGTPQPADL